MKKFDRELRGILQPPLAGVREWEMAEEAKRAQAAADEAILRRERAKLREERDIANGRVYVVPYAAQLNQTDLFLHWLGQRKLEPRGD